MNQNSLWMRLLTAVVLLVVACGASAQWELDAARSRVNFVSIKNTSVAEVHSFTKLVGYIGSDGKGSVHRAGD